MTAANVFDKLSSRIFLFLLAAYAYSAIFEETWIFLLLAALTLASFELLLGILSRTNRFSARALRRQTLRALSLSSAEEQIDLFARALANYQPQRKSDRILFRREGLRCALFVKFSREPLTDRDVAEFVRSERTADEIYILCRSSEFPARTLAEGYTSCRVILYEQSEIFRMLRKHETFPAQPPEPKAGLSRLFSRMFLARNAKGYFLAGLVILAFSFFSPLRIYYLAAGGICFVLSFVCLVRRGRHSPPDVL